MKATQQPDVQFVPIVPVDDMTRTMLAYANSPEGRAKITNARRELEDGKGIMITPRYFDDLKRRISRRAGGTHSIAA